MEQPIFSTKGTATSQDVKWYTIYSTLLPTIVLYIFLVLLTLMYMKVGAQDILWIIISFAIGFPILLGLATYIRVSKIKENMEYRFYDEHMEFTDPLVFVRAKLKYEDIETVELIEGEDSLLVKLREPDPSDELVATTGKDDTYESLDNTLVIRGVENPQEVYSKIKEIIK